MTDERYSAMESAMESAVREVSTSLKNERISLITRHKPWHIGDESFLIVDTQTLFKSEMEEYQGHPYVRLYGVGMTLRSVFESGCMLDRNGQDLTTSRSLVESMVATILAAGVDFVDGVHIPIKVKQITQVLRYGTLNQRVVWQLV